MGTAEIYQAVLSIDEVVDALVVDLPKVDRVAGLDAVANPESLDYFVALSQPT